MKINTAKHGKFTTKDADGNANGYLVPVYNINEKFYPAGEEPQQVYMTTVKPGTIKGPHLHYIRRGCFTCIKGNIRVVLRVEGEYQVFFSGEDYEYQSIEIPKGIPAALQCLGDEEAMVLNMPFPAWTPEQNDEHSADFSDFDFETI